MTDCRYLFVYGTLMSGARSVLGHEERVRLALESDSLGPASLPHARLYDLDHYPGAAPSDDDDDIVHGEAVLLSDPQATLQWVDDYEGVIASDQAGNDDLSEYDRLVCQVRLAGGETFDAWVYLLRRAPGAERLIASGRWMRG
jgi:gamma-glutamylcyclotransferase (GGCT)/AIG2-like uncharacterized protein YtfP